MTNPQAGGARKPGYYRVIWTEGYPEACAEWDGKCWLDDGTDYGYAPHWIGERIPSSETLAALRALADGVDADVIEEAVAGAMWRTPAGMAVRRIAAAKRALLATEGQS